MPASRRVLRALSATLVLGLTVLVPGASADTNADMTNALTSANGTKGWLVKKTSGTVLASKNASTVFEPASAIKFMHHLHAELAIQANPSIKNAFTTPWVGSCPTPAPPPTLFGDPLQIAMSKMMHQSDNAATHSILQFFGQDEINETAHDLGATDSLLQHKHGCGADAIAKPNKWTLNDAALLYKKAFTGNLLTAESRKHMWDRMPSFLKQLKDTAVIEWFDEFGSNPPAEFLDNIKVAYKPGGYVLCSPTCKRYVAIAGYAEIPVKSIYGPMPRRYLFGIFVHGSTTAENTLNTSFSLATRAILREEMTKAVATW